MVAPGALVLLLKYAGAGAGASSGAGTEVLLDISADFYNLLCTQTNWDQHMSLHYYYSSGVLILHI